MSKKAGRFALRRSLIAASVAACFTLSSQHSSANPSGGTVVSGSASFAASGNTLVITNSANAIINWQGFSIGINEITRFLQSSAGSAVLNRVVGANGVIPQSVIDGALQSNGRVFLINPNGIVFGASARIDVGGLVASSLNLSNEDFLAGKLRFTEVPGAAGVTNNGAITTPSGGKVYLVAPSVENNGIITAPQGEILLAAGKSAELVSESSPYVTVKITADSERALNVGSLIADSGRVGMYGALVRNSGVAEASGAVAGPGGQIRFVATKDLTLDAGSRTAANGTSGGDVLLQAQGGTNLISGTVEAKGSTGQGGTVQALGVRVGVVGRGVIDASGDTGGGTVLVGGDYQGKNADVQNSQLSVIGPDGIIRADAGTTGDGGRVIVWSDGNTGFYGGISARGGLQSGNGGFVETSGKQSLQALGSVDTRAPTGKSGSWLLDPTDITVSSGDNGAGYYVGVNGGLFLSNPYGEPPTSIVAASAIEGYYGLVTLQASNDVNFNANVNKTNGGLSVSANHDINLNSSVISVGGPINLTASGSISSTIPTGTVQLRTDGSASPVPDTSVFLQATAANGGGTVTVGGIKTGNAQGAGDANSYAQINANGGVTVNGSITTGTANSTSSSSNTADASIYFNNNAGDIAINGNLSAGAATKASGGGGYAYSEVAIGNTPGNVTVTGSITTSTATGPESYADVGIQGVTISTGAISTGNAVASGGDAYSNVALTGTSGITVNGAIQTGSATTASNGMASSEVNLNSSAGAISAGAISTGSATSVSSSGSSSFYGSSYGAMVVGSISTGAATGLYGASVVELSGSSSIGTGPIRTGNATASGGNPQSYVSLSTSGGGVSVGADSNGVSIATGSTSGTSGDSGVDVDVNGSIVTGGAITTGTAGQYSSVYLSSAGGISVGGPISTASGAFNTYVQLSASGSISTGDITTGNASTGGNSFVLVSSAGSISAGNIRTGAADGGEGSVILSAGGGPSTGISVGSIQTGATASSEVILQAGGSISTGPITTGGNTNSYGNGSYVSIFSSYGSVSAGDINTGSTLGGSSSVNLNAAGGIAVGNVATGSSPSGLSYVTYYANSGGVSAGSIFTGESGDRNITVSGAGDVSVGPITARASTPGAMGGRVALASSTGRIIVNGDIDVRGADGNASSPWGGYGGSVFMSSGATSATPGVPTIQVKGSILASGGNGATAPFYTGSGGQGGQVAIGSDGIEGGPTSPPTMPVIGSISVVGKIVSTGGRGGDGAAGYGGGMGGAGGAVTLLATDSVMVGPTPKFQVFPTAMDVSGGAGGAGSPGFAGGAGGAAGSITVDPIAITINGTLFALGGAGGSGSPQGAGGAGGTLELLAPGGIITFFNGGFDLSGGAGSPPGAAGSPTVQGTLAFLFVANPDVFTIPSVAQSISTTVNNVLAAVKEDNGTKPQDDDPKNRKRSGSSCKP